MQKQNNDPIVRFEFRRSRQFAQKEIDEGDWKKRKSEYEKEVYRELKRSVRA